MSVDTPVTAQVPAQAITLRSLSALLCYPEAALIEALDELRSGFGAAPYCQLAGLFDLLQSLPLVRLQEQYVDTFDRNPAQSLHLFEHIHGESRERGQAMVDLLAEYRQAGFEPDVAELPDYVPLFLEFLSVVEPARVVPLLDDAIHVLAAIGGKLARNGSPYAGVFAVLQQMASVEPQPLATPPVRDMEEAMEMFGPGADGVEPLLRTGDTQTIQFHARRPAAGLPPAACA